MLEKEDLGKVDLSKVDPTGRVDVACYKLVKAAIEQWENVFGIKIGDMIDPHLQAQVREMIPNEVVDGVSRVIKKFQGLRIEGIEGIEGKKR